jgi:hypothetical protein
MKIECGLLRLRSNNLSAEQLFQHFGSEYKYLAE